MMTPSLPTKPHRGIIVVDANVLISLAAPVSVALKRKDAANDTYLSALEWLGENGFEIVIPEMVSVEAGRVIIDDTSPGGLIDLNKFFATRSHADGARLTFLTGKKPGIVIRPSCGPQHVDAHIKKLHQAAADPETARDNIIKIQANRNKHRGEEAALEILKKENTDAPVFFLSEEPSALREALAIHTQTKIIALNTRGLLEALIVNGLHDKLGIENTATIQEVYQNINDYRQEPNEPPREFPPCVDTSSSLEKHRQDKPFSNKITELLHSLSATDSQMDGDGWQRRISTDPPPSSPLPPFS